MALISKVGSGDITLDTIANVDGFDNALAGTPYALLRARVGTAYKPISATAAIALDPDGGLGLNPSDQLQIKVDNTSGDPGLDLSSDGVEVVGRVKTAGDAMTGDLVMHAPISMNNNFVGGVRDPAAPQDAATKAYVDSSSGGTTILTFDYEEIRFDGAMGLPSSDINGNWTLGGDVSRLPESILDQSVIRLTDNAPAFVSSARKSLTVQNWQDLFDYGGSLRWKGRCSASAGTNGGAFWVGCDVPDSPVVGETESRRYIVFFANPLAAGILNIKNAGATSIATGISATDQYTVIEVQIPPGLGTASLYINGILSSLPIPYASSSVETTEVIVSSGSVGGTLRTSYVADFGIIIYKDSPLRTIVTPNIGTRVIVPWGPRTYIIKAAEIVTTVPVGITFELWANNVGGTIEFTQENLLNPRMSFDGRISKIYNISSPMVLHAVQTSRDTPRITFSHDVGSYFHALSHPTEGGSRYTSSSVTMEHTGVLTVDATEWSMGASGTGTAMEHSGYISQTPTRIISGALSVASSNTGAMVEEVSVSIIIDGVTTPYFILKLLDEYSGVTTFPAPIYVPPGGVVAITTRTNLTSSIVTGHVTLQMISLV